MWVSEKRLWGDCQTGVVEGDRRVWVWGQRAPWRKGSLWFFSLLLLPNLYTQHSVCLTANRQGSLLITSTPLILFPLPELCLACLFPNSSSKWKTVFIHSTNIYQESSVLKIASFSKYKYNVLYLAILLTFCFRFWESSRRQSKQKFLPLWSLHSRAGRRIINKEKYKLITTWC